MSPGNGDDDRADGIARALAALTAVAGLSALVAFTGGAIVWVRYQQAKLPADQAVAITPESSLLATGGAALGLFAIVGALAVLVAYLIDHQGTRARQAVGVTVVAGIGVAVAALATDAPWDDRIIAVIVVAAATIAAVAIAIVVNEHATKQWLARNRWRLVIAAGAAVVVGVLVLWLVLDESLAAIALAILGALLLGLACLGLSSRTAGKIELTLAMPALVVLVAVVLGLMLHAWWIAVVVLVAGALIAGVLTVADRSGKKFRWYGAAVFVAVVIFGAAMNALRTWDVPRLQPMALLFTQQAGGGGQAGLFVGQTSDRVYLGLVKRCRRDRDLVLRPGGVVSGSGEIVSVPRSSVAAEAVGSVGHLEDALQRAPKLLGELAKRFGQSAASSAELPVDPCSDEGTPDLKVRTSTPVDPVKAQQLAELYRPVLLFDRSERWRPLNVDRLLVESGPAGPIHRLCDGVEESALHCPPITAASQISAQPNSPAAFVDLQGTHLGGTDYRSPTLSACPPSSAPQLQDCDSGPASAIYYRAVAANGRTYIDYWWFLRYNRFEKHSASELCRSLLTSRNACFDHEGDWEGVTAVTAVGDDQRLEFVDYAAHEGVFRYPLNQLQMQGQRPTVFVANGSHASYPRACPRKCAQVAKLLGHALPEDNTDGTQPWGRNDQSECDQAPKCVQPLPAGSWGSFAGFWGSQTCVGGGSCHYGVPPRSPSRQRRFISPWCFSGPGLVLSCDGRLPS
jgi:hypothetical protein